MKYSIIKVADDWFPFYHIDKLFSFIYDRAQDTIFLVFLCSYQCDQIGLFLKGLGEIFSYKRSPNIQ